MGVQFVLEYLQWHFLEAPKAILKGWGNFLWFGINFFSIPEVVRTFFSPWRGIRWSYGRGFDPGRYLYVFASNLVSRVIGAVMRSLLILIGVLGEIGILFLGLGAFLGWFLLPVFIFGGVFYGIRILL